MQLYALEGGSARQKKTTHTHTAMQPCKLDGPTPVDPPIHTAPACNAEQRTLSRAVGSRIQASSDPCREPCAITLSDIAEIRISSACSPRLALASHRPYAS
jgi:hypothetical protein